MLTTKLEAALSAWAQGRLNHRRPQEIYPVFPQTYDHRDVGVYGPRQRHSRMVGETPWE